MNIAVLFSGGTGLRMGADIPKQYMEVGGKPVIS
ncbi:MAG: 2-C-methyl-D-erythritol 4-phosphate cytidylyltransferase, partial [Lachnospiraceae bacterium]|nr:2-C-methyl-D-erythritol 4-phosphate cytidylyltransferase [Lachnospiraceae bacterium]